jgi:ABC-type lipoprotein release transport system permease subunit
MSLYVRLAWRNIWRHRRRTFIIILAIAFTMMLMMMYDGLIDGFNNAIYANAIKVLGGNIQIHAPGYQEKADQTPLLALPNDPAALLGAARALPQVESASLRLKTGGLVTDKEGAFAVSIIGLQPDQEKAVSLLAQHVVMGRYLQPDDRDLIFIGRGLAEALDVNVEDRVTLSGRATHDQMRQRTMTVAGIYDIGMADIEKQTVYMNLAEAQDLYGMSGQANEMVITLKQLGQEPAVMSALRPSLSAGQEINSWEVNYPELQSTIAAKSKSMDVFSFIMVVIVGIGILNLLLMAVYERTREIGVLGAFGVRPGQISSLFLLEGALLGLLGAAVGAALGIGLNAMMGSVGFDYSQFSSMTSYTALISGRVYSSLGLSKLAGHVIMVVVITVLASFYPAWEAAHREPAEALHYV